MDRREWLETAVNLDMSYMTLVSYMLNFLFLFSSFFFFK